MGDQVTPQTGLTVEQQAECQTAVDRVIAEYQRADIVAKVREHAGWTDPDTGEWFSPEWVIETRIGRGEGSVVLTLSSSEPMFAPLDQCWIDSLREEIDYQLRVGLGARP